MNKVILACAVCLAAACGGRVEDLGSLSEPLSQWSGFIAEGQFDSTGHPECFTMNGDNLTFSVQTCNPGNNQQNFFLSTSQIDALLEIGPKAFVFRQSLYWRVDNSKCVGAVPVNGITQPRLIPCDVNHDSQNEVTYTNGALYAVHQGLCLTNTSPIWVPCLPSNAAGTSWAPANHSCVFEADGINNGPGYLEGGTTRTRLVAATEPTSGTVIDGIMQPAAGQTWCVEPTFLPIFSVAQSAIALGPCSAAGKFLNAVGSGGMTGDMTPNSASAVALSIRRASWPGVTADSTIQFATANGTWINPPNVGAAEGWNTAGPQSPSNEIPMHCNGAF